MRNLPVYREKDKILKALEENQVIIVESPTGSGKTTQMPIILQEAGYDKAGIIGITQPRRIAALSIADYIKDQLGLSNNYVACTMRFYDTSDDTTKIKVMTDGILLQELKSDPLLKRYSVIMIDESHERSLNIDFILGLLKQVLIERQDIRIIISSATINTKAFSDFYNGAKIISIDSKTYPIEVKYRPLQTSNTDELYDKITQIIERQAKDNKGDVLVFLPGEYDIKGVMMTLSKSQYSSYLQVYPLYSRLAKEDQEKVFTPTIDGMTKVVLATNIAETSITIDGITCVIDPGYAKVNFYNPKTLTSSLNTIGIAKSSANQRMGRSGRTQEGTCYRFYSQDSFNQRDEYLTEEILRSDLSEVCLRMSDLGIYDYNNFPFITKPSESSIKSAEETLYFIDAIDKDRHLTNIGALMVQFPLLPTQSRVLVEAILNYPEVLCEIIIALSFLSTKSPFLFPKDNAAKRQQETLQDPALGDFNVYLKLFHLYEKQVEKKRGEAFCKKYSLDFDCMNEIVHINEQLCKIVSAMGLSLTSGGSLDQYFICLASGLKQFVCYNYRKGVYKSLTQDSIYIHPACSWFNSPPKYILAGEIMKTSRTFARTVSPLNEKILKAIDEKLIDKLKDSRSNTSNGRSGFVTIFSSTYPTDENNNALIKLNDVDDIIEQAYEVGKVKKGVSLYLVHKGAQTKHTMSLKELVQECSLMAQGLYLYDNQECVMTLRDVALNLNKVLCFAIDKQKGLIKFSGLQLKNNQVRLKTFSKAPVCIDSTYSALLYVKNNMKRNNKNYNKICKFISRIQASEGL